MASFPLCFVPFDVGDEVITLNMIKSAPVGPVAGGIMGCIMVLVLAVYAYRHQIHRRSHQHMSPLAAQGELITLEREMGGFGIKPTTKENPNPTKHKPTKPNTKLTKKIPNIFPWLCFSASPLFISLLLTLTAAWSHPGHCVLLPSSGCCQACCHPKSLTCSSCPEAERWLC